jgi:hypothetical protein
MEWLRVTEKEISTSGNPFRELTWPCILLYLVGENSSKTKIWKLFEKSLKW